MNIIWQQPNKTLAVTTVFLATLAQMEEARGYADLVPYRADLEARDKAGREALARLEAARAAVVPDYPAPPAEDAEPEAIAEYEAACHQAVQAAQAEVQRLADEMAALVEGLSPVADALGKLAIHDQVVANIGLTVEDHARLLQSRGDIPADWTVAAIGLAEEDFPQDWPRQEDWILEDGPVARIVVSIERARETTKNRLRAERAPLLAALDVQFILALERCEDTSAVFVEKQRLRDITTLPDACTTLAELKALSCTP